MKLVIVIIMVILLISTNSKQNETSFPYHVALIIDATQFCSGVIISQRYILTAARCLRDSMEADVIMGNPQLLEQPINEIVMIATIFLQDPTNQIVLIQLPYELNFNQFITIAPINLPFNINLLDYQEFIVTGWTEIVGSNQQLTLPLSHKKINIKQIQIVENNQCQFAIIMEDGRNIEDYGSPLITITDSYLIGIVILAQDSQIVYANISCYTEWISTILQGI